MQAAVVSGGDRGDDREPEADAFTGGGPVDRKPAKRLPELPHLLFLQSRAAVFDDKKCGSALATGPGVDEPERSL
jgi:hypothetical protein